MRSRAATILAMGAMLVALTGCASSPARYEYSGLPSAENPEYLAHPFRLVALAGYAVGSALQYGVVEPLYLAVAPTPDAVGLSAEEQRYLAREKQAYGALFSPTPETSGNAAVR